MKNRHFKKTLLIVSLILNVSLIGAILAGYCPLTPISAQNQYPLLSRRIFAYNQNDYLINFVPLRKQLRELIAKSDNKLGLYFEYLPTGTSIGVNEKNEHKFASLLKVPVVMAYYLQSKAEGTPFDQTFTIRADQLDAEFGDLYLKGEGTQITTKEVIDQMLVNSDNTASNILADNTKKGYMRQVFDGLDISLEHDDEGKQIISPKTYASIYRALYLSAIVPKEESEKILEILSQSTAKEAIRMGVPDDIKVANKIGVLKDALFWDCGIVYIPKRPYLLCAFSTYPDLKTSENKISEISKTIYDFVSQANY